MNSVIPADVAASPSPVALFGYAHPRPGREAELEATLRSFLTPTRAEAGALAYEVHAVPDAPGVMAFYEHWASGLALAEHLRLPQMQGFLATRMELLERDLEIRFLTPLAATTDAEKASR
ncbi:MAG: putative quinol monooxygenase [Pseudoclavibacter sp.]